MVIRDAIYGRITIDEPVIAELIQSSPMQRLKSILQHGPATFIQPVRTMTRFEHSVGAWYLSWRYKRPIEEQIASLLHDVPHTAFSHVADIVMNDATHEYHDRFTKEIITKSEIPAILKKHNVSLDAVLNKEGYALLENKLPDISVDRWDYFMRDGYTVGLMPKQTIKLFLASVKEKNQQFYFEDARVAGLFAVLFMNCSRLIWLDPTSHGAHYLLAGVLRTALDKGILVHEELFETDAYVWDKLQASGDEQINVLLARLQPGRDFAYAPKEMAEFYGINKPRTVDPLVEQDGELVRLSLIVPGLSEYFEEFKARHQYLGVVQK